VIREWLARRRAQVAAETERQAAIREMRRETEDYVAELRARETPEQREAFFRKLREDNHREYERLVQRKIAERRARAK
jgi:hypothetical protein